MKNIVLKAPAALLILFGMAPLTEALSQPKFRRDPLKIVVPFTAGGAVDHVARIVANGLPDGVPASVENRSGAGGDIGVVAVANAAPDGNTVLLHTSSLVINAVARGKGEEVEKQLEPLMKVGGVKFVLVVRSNLPLKTLGEFVAHARTEKPMSYGSTGPATTLNIAAEMLKSEFGIPGVHVPYRGLNPAFTDMLSGNIEFMVTSLSGVLPYIESGKMRALAVFSDERAPQLPDVPTTVELGHPKLQISNWYGLFTGSKVSPEKRDELEKLFLQVVRQDAVQKQLAKEGVTGIQTADEFRQALSKEWTGFASVLGQLNLGK